MRSDWEKQTPFRLYCAQMYVEYVMECEAFNQSYLESQDYFNRNKSFLKKQYKHKLAAIKELKIKTV